MNKIQRSLNRAKRKMLNRRKERYALAISLGFNCYEANVMAGWSEKRIRAAVDKVADDMNGR
jgi:hypothetical protein